MKILRTPDERFENLPGYPFAPHYTEVPDGDGGRLRIHHVDEGPRDGAVVLCMHGQPTWSYLYRHMIPLLVGAGLRVLAPDLVGYGRSDKLGALEDYSYQRQVDWLTAWLVANELQDATFFGQDWGGLIGLRMVAENPERFDRVAIGNTGLPAPRGVSEERAARVRKFRAEAPTPTLPEVMRALGKADPKEFEQSFAYWQKWCWETEDLPVGMMIAGTIDGRTLSAEEVAAYDAPFPDPSYKMGVRAMPSQVPSLSDDPSVEANLRAWEVFSKWDKPFLCAYTDNDPVSSGRDAEFRSRVPGAQGQPHQIISGGGHFLQEGRGDVLAQILIDFIEANPMARAG
jgi:haloalkane dehalogenase